MYPPLRALAEVSILLSLGQGRRESIVYDVFGSQMMTDPAQTMTRSEVFARGGHVAAQRYRGDTMLMLFEDRSGALWLGDDNGSDDVALCRRLVHDDSAWRELVNSLDLG